MGFDESSPPPAYEATNPAPPQQAGPQPDGAPSQAPPPYPAEGQQPYSQPPQGYPPQYPPQQQQNPLYPQQGYPPPPQQGGYPPQQAGYPPPQQYPPQQGGYPPQGYPPPGYPPQGYPPGGAPPPQQTRTTVILNGAPTDQQQTIAMAIFIIGFCTWCVWLGGFAFIRSPNRTTRIFGILSVVFFFVGLLAWLIPVIVVVSLASAAVSAANSAANSGMSYTVYSYYTGTSGTYVSMGGNSCRKVTYDSGSWSSTNPSSNGYVTASGSSGTNCNAVNCPSRYSPMMSLVAQCSGSSSSTYNVGSSGNVYCSYGFYLMPNDSSSTLSDNDGFITVRVGSC